METSYSESHYRCIVTPDLLSVAKIEKGMLTVTWDDATDDVTPAEALFYNVYVKNNNTGKISMIIPANPETGRLKVITDYSK